jgi:hypothetical protein
MSKRNKKQRMKESHARSSMIINGKDVVDIERVVKRFDFENNDHVTEFVNNGGLTLCRYAFDIESGCLSSSGAFREAMVGIDEDHNTTLTSLCTVIKLLVKESNERLAIADTDDSTGVDDNCIVPTTGEGSVESTKDLVEDMFTSGACISVTDMVQYLLLSFQTWGSSHLPRVLNTRNHKTDKHHHRSAKKQGLAGGANGTNKSASKKRAGGDGESVFGTDSPLAAGGPRHGIYPMVTPSKGSGGDHNKTALPVDIKWPPQLKLFLPSLLLVMSRLCQHSSRHIIRMRNTDKKPVCKWFEHTKHWISYVSSSGLIECLGNSIRDVQCIAGNCCTDPVVFDLLTELSSFVGHYFTLLR